MGSRAVGCRKKKKVTVSRIDELTENRSTGRFLSFFLHGKPGTKEQDRLAKNKGRERTDREAE